MILVNSFDVEPWWTTVPPCVDLERWSEMPDRSERPFMDYLDLCDEMGVRCTFFFIGWYAKTWPGRVAEVVRRGHEAGCHSLFHEDVGLLADDTFRATTCDAKAMIEDAAGGPVIAYRAPSFSLPRTGTARLFQALVDLGFEIDSSISTAARVHGGGFARHTFGGPMSLKATFGVDLFEIPVPGVSLFGRDVQLFGGGYLRLAPTALLERFAASEAYQVLYVHPHDFDASLPPLPNAGMGANLRRNLRIGDTRTKVKRLFGSADVLSCSEVRDRARVDA